MGLGPLYVVLPNFLVVKGSGSLVTNCAHINSDGSPSGSIILTGAWGEMFVGMTWTRPSGVLKIKDNLLYPNTSPLG